MTQVWVVTLNRDQWDEYSHPEPVAAFATHEEADAYLRKVDNWPRERYEVEGPIPFGLAAMVTP